MEYGPAKRKAAQAARAQQRARRRAARQRRGRRRGARLPRAVLRRHPAGRAAPRCARWRAHWMERLARVPAAPDRRRLARHGHAAEQRAPAAVLRRLQGGRDRAASTCGIDYDVGSRPGPARRDVDVLSVSQPAAARSASRSRVHLSVLDHDDLRGALKPDARGRPQRGDLAALRRLARTEVRHEAARACSSAAWPARRPLRRRRRGLVAAARSSEPPLRRRTSGTAASSSPDGGELALAGLRGQPLVLNFWATWCPPCVSEMPLLDRFHREQQPRGLAGGRPGGRQPDAGARVPAPARRWPCRSAWPGSRASSSVAQLGNTAGRTALHRGLRRRRAGPLAQARRTQAEPTSTAWTATLGLTTSQAPTAAKVNCWQVATKRVKSRRFGASKQR